MRQAPPRGSPLGAEGMAKRSSWPGRPPTFCVPSIAVSWDFRAQTLLATKSGAFGGRCVGKRLPVSYALILSSVVEAIKSSRWVPTVSTVSTVSDLDGHVQPRSA